MPEKTEAQKRAQKKYMEKFMVARVRMERERYERVQTHAEAQGESVNGFINRAIDHQISQDCDKGPCEAQQAGGISLHLEALQTAQNAAQKAGETVSQFVERAVEETADGDALPKAVIFGRAVDVVAEHYGVSCWDVLKELEGLVDEQGESR